MLCIRSAWRLYRCRWQRLIGMIVGTRYMATPSSRWSVRVPTNRSSAEPPEGRMGAIQTSRFALRCTFPPSPTMQRAAPPRGAWEMACHQSPGANPALIRAPPLRGGKQSQRRRRWRLFIRLLSLTRVGCAHCTLVYTRLSTFGRDNP